MTKLEFKTYIPTKPGLYYYRVNKDNNDLQACFVIELPNGEIKYNDYGTPTNAPDYYKYFQFTTEPIEIVNLDPIEIEPPKEIDYVWYDWDNAPEWALWAAQDYNDEGIWFSEKPELDDHDFWFMKLRVDAKHKIEKIPPSFYKRAGDPNGWRESLRVNPKKKIN